MISEAVHVEGTNIDLHVSSHVKEVAAVLKVLGQGRPHVKSIVAMVAEEPTCASPSNEVEVVIRTKAICLDNDEDTSEGCVGLDMKVRVKDRVPYRILGMFADYMTNDSDDKDYKKPEYSIVKLNFIDDPFLMFVTRSPAKASDKDKGKESDENDKVNFVPFVDKYLSEVAETVRVNLTYMYKSYDYQKMFAYLSTPTFCEAVKVKHILHTASLLKIKKRLTAFEAPKEHQGRDQFQGFMTMQVDSIEDSILEIIDISGVLETSKNEVHVAVIESSSPRIG